MGNEWIIALILVVSYLMYIRSKRRKKSEPSDR